MPEISVVIGATGLVGNLLCQHLSQNKEKVIAITRRPIVNLSNNIDNLVVDFDNFISNGEFPACDHLYLCLGTTIKKAGSKENFKKIDLDYTVALAKKAKEAGASKVSLISSVGADLYSKNFYLSIKGKVEKKLEELDFTSVHIFRPSLLLGDRGERRILEDIGQKLFFLINIFLIGSFRKYRCVRASLVASSMANSPTTRGLRYFYFDDFTSY